MINKKIKMDKLNKKNMHKNQQKSTSCHAAPLDGSASSAGTAAAVGDNMQGAGTPSQQGAGGSKPPVARFRRATRRIPRDTSRDGRRCARTLFFVRRKHGKRTATQRTRDSYFEGLHTVYVARIRSSVTRATMAPAAISAGVLHWSAGSSSAAVSAAAAAAACQDNRIEMATLIDVFDQCNLN